MARVTTVKSARKSPGSCQVCQKEIVKGDSYLWWAFYRAGKNIRCLDHRPRASETTGSETESMGLAISEGLSLEPIPPETEDADILKTDVVEAIDAISEVIQEKMDNIESGFGHTDVPSYYDQEELLSAHQSWADEIEALDPQEFSGEGDACKKCGLGQWDGDHGTGEGHHQFEAEWEFYGEDFMDELRGLVDQGAEG